MRKLWQRATKTEPWLVVSSSWEKTRKRVNAAEEDVFMAVASAIGAATVAVAKVVSGSWTEALWAALVTGFLALAFFFGITFLYYLIGAPKRLRREHAASPGEFGGSELLFAARLRDADVMQREAAFIIAAISQVRGDDYLREKPWWWVRNGSSMQIAIDRFGERAQNDRWISWRARRRSQKLHKQLIATTDVDTILRLCREFQQLPARH